MATEKSAQFAYNIFDKGFFIFICHTEPQARENSLELIELSSINKAGLV
jgi:hypothetical protein